MKRIQLGSSDFKELVKENYYYIDKSELIKDLLNDGSKVILLPRPRRFGKTINLSMLRYFFDNSKDNSDLFKDLKIWKNEEVRSECGKYPVIYLTFKDIKEKTFASCYEKMVGIIQEEYDKHNYLLKTKRLSEFEKEYYTRVLYGKGSQADYENSIKSLSKFLNKENEQRVVILIDEYDMPIQSGYIGEYYEDVIGFMRNFLSGALKDNESLEKAVLTGILRVAKESIFSGLNNLNVCTILKNRYSQYFGFLENEVEDILKYYNVEYKLEEIKKWYNGYTFGNNIIYNPWSILNYTLNKEDGLIPYWVNTSSNDIVKKLITNGGEELKKDIEVLIKNGEIEKLIDENIVMGDVEKGSDNVWSFLLFSGYLKVVGKEQRDKKVYYKLKIPNVEVEYLYEEIILDWFDENLSNEKFAYMLKSLVNGDIKTFGKILRDFVRNSMSYFDPSGKDSEKVYHAFVLGMLLGLSDNYEVKSNRESGYGRYDVMVIPKDNKKLGIIMEFKKVDEEDGETLESAVEEALKQIEEKEYRAELEVRGVGEIVCVGVGFRGKEILVESS